MIASLFISEFRQMVIDNYLEEITDYDENGKATVNIGEAEQSVLNEINEQHTIELLMQWERAAYELSEGEYLEYLGPALDTAAHRVEAKMARIAAMEAEGVEPIN